MTGARTTVGIVEWARRARGARAVELQLADRLGTWVASAPDAATKVAIVRQARRHAWRADQWDSVVPVLHDVDLTAVDSIDDDELRSALARVDGAAAPADALAAAAAATGRLVEMWRAWAGEAAPVADAPCSRVLHLVIRDSVEDPGP